MCVLLAVGCRRPYQGGGALDLARQRVDWCGFGAVVCVGVSNTCRFGLDARDAPRLATCAGMNGRLVVVQGLIGQGCRATCAAVLALLVCAGVRRRGAMATGSAVVRQPAAARARARSSRAADGLWKVAVAPGRRPRVRDRVRLEGDPDLRPQPGTGALTQRGAGGCISETGYRLRAGTRARQPDRDRDQPGRRATCYVVVGSRRVAVFDRNPRPAISRRSRRVAAASPRRRVTAGGAPDCALAPGRGRRRW